MHLLLGLEDSQPWRKQLPGKGCLLLPPPSHLRVHYHLPPENKINGKAGCSSYASKIICEESYEALVPLSPGISLYLGGEGGRGKPTAVILPSKRFQPLAHLIITIKVNKSYFLWMTLFWVPQNAMFHSSKYLCLGKVTPRLNQNVSTSSHRRKTLKQIEKDESLTWLMNIISQGGLNSL